MAVINQKDLCKHICDWIQDYTLKNNKKSLIVGLHNEPPWPNNDPGCFLIAYLCSKLSINLFVRSQYHNVEQDKLIETIGIQYYNTTSLDHFRFAANLVEEADYRNGLVVGSINKSAMLTRHYGKYTHALADIFPIADLYESEVRSIVYSIVGDINTPNTISNLLLDYDEIEWADKENNKTNIITRDTRPQDDKYWYKYTVRQKEIISRIYQIEKKTRHKSINNKPICIARQNSFVR